MKLAGKAPNTLDARAQANNRNDSKDPRRHRVGDHNPADRSASASASMNGLAIETSWHGVGDRDDRTGPDEKLWTGRLEEPSFKLLFETHAFMDRTDTHTYTHTHTHGQTRNNVARSRLALTAQTRQLYPCTYPQVCLSAICSKCACCAKFNDIHFLFSHSCCVFEHIGHILAAVHRQAVKPKIVRS